MNPYRAIVHRDMKPVKPGRTLAGRLRSAWRRWLVWRGGTWRSRWERCDRCMKRFAPGVMLGGMCSSCWRSWGPANLVVPVMVPDGETAKVRV